MPERPKRREIIRRKEPFTELNESVLKRLAEKSWLFKEFNPIMKSDKTIIDHSKLMEDCEKTRKSYMSYVVSKSGDRKKLIEKLKENHDEALTLLKVMHSAKPFEEGSILTTLSYPTKTFKKPIPAQALKWTEREFEAYSLDNEEHTPRPEFKDHIFAVMDGKLFSLIKFKKL